ncbi:hypothetical protein K461DRAFT_146627 [Myriangium duriaei CBS 260.36]|uniref:Uncharacterized protein n=1 Tax=Myriangium duriaei CBS 260.36 TaxID=1168546 RepID=A0A9P4J377_9PEZI|nr:hypothetical protein K461DRAFT_146627 [Myriangium duriaei CBS 260.36]
MQENRKCNACSLSSSRIVTMHCRAECMFVNNGSTALPGQPVCAFHSSVQIHHQLERDLSRVRIKALACLLLLLAVAGVLCMIGPTLVRCCGPWHENASQGRRTEHGTRCTTRSTRSLFMSSRG